MSKRIIILSLTGFVTIGFVVAGFLGILDLFIVKVLLYAAFFTVCAFIIERLVKQPANKKPSQHDSL